MDIVRWSERVARDVLVDDLPRRWAHVQGVARKARLASCLFDKEESDLLVAAAFLHDVGYGPKINSTGFHPLDGARYLEELGFENRLCALVAHHSCAYLEAELRNLSRYLSAWTDEETSLRDALWWSDMTTTPDGQPVDVHERIDEIQERYGAQDLVTFFIRQAKPELVDAVRRTEERISAAGFDQMVK